MVTLPSKRLASASLCALLIKVVLVLAFATAPFILAAQEQQNAEALNNPSEDSFDERCERIAGADKQRLAKCIESRFEVITVTGQRALPVSIGLTGKYSLDRDFLNASAKGNGNITDMLVNLPGIQGSDGALEVGQQAEIRSQLISISGAQPWQTGFFFDNVSNNSLLDPGAAQRSVATVNDVQGHPQSSFINQNLVGEVTVYDSNVPAKFGQFSGGVVDVQPRSFFQTPSFKLDYRLTSSRWNNYRLIDERSLNEDDPLGIDRELPREPSFQKQTLSILGKTKLFDDHEVTLSMSRTTSKIDEASLNSFVENTRESISASLQYRIKDVWFDEVRLHANYSPYDGEHLLVDVLNSRLSNKGGGLSFSINTKEDFDSFTWNSRYSYSQSENTRESPNVFLPWYRAAGKAWGINSGDVPFSIEGGYGDIEKLQTRYAIDNDFAFDEFALFNGEFLFSGGVSFDYVELERNRTRTALIYNSPFRDANINCNGQSLDCIEQSFVIPLDEFAAQFGGAIDFSDPVQSQAYQDNLLTRGQFFQYRRVYPIEDIVVDRESAAIYADSRLEYDHVRINFGLRGDYDSIFENLNIAPRFSVGIDPFANNEYLISLGINRYYSSGPLSYLIREQQRPYITQYRTISDGSVGQWLSSTQAERFSYDYSNLDTPFNDELSLGYQQSLFGGILSLKAVYREQKSQVTRNDSEVVNGITVITQDNEGSGTHERLTASYNIAFENHDVWFHISHTSNESSRSSYDDSVDNIPEDELVVLRTIGSGGFVLNRLISQDDLSLRNLDFSRPITANLTLQSRWSHNFSTTVNVSHVGAFQSAINTNQLIEIERDISVCQNCDVTTLSYPLFLDVNRSAVTLVGLLGSVDVKMGQHKVDLSVEINNVLDARTYSVGPRQTGLEVGRSFWLGASYSW